MNAKNGLGKHACTKVRGWMEGGKEGGRTAENVRRIPAAASGVEECMKVRPVLLVVM